MTSSHWPIVALIAGFSLLLSGCGQTTRTNYLRLPYQGIPEYAPPEISLKQKADLFQEQLGRDHISPIGLMIYLKVRRADGSIDPSYLGLNDSPIWGGIHLASESFRYAVTGSEEALTAVRQSVKGLHLLQAVTGVPGLLARHIAPAGDPGVDFLKDRGNRRWVDAAEGYPGLRWRCDVSKDQYSGMIFGYSVAYELVPDEEIREQIRQDMTAIADFFIRNDYHIVDFDGVRTKYHSLQAHVGPIPIGVHALISLAAIKVAYQVSGEPRFKEEYQRLVERRWPQATWLAKFQIFGQTNHNNDNMAFLSYYSLLRLEKDPVILDCYRRSANRSWKYVRNEGNSFWNFIYLGSGGEDALGLEEARLQLRNFPATKLGYQMDLRGRTDIERSWFKNRKGVPRAKYPLPINLRSHSSFDWKSCPYALTSGSGVDGTKQFVPVDYLVCYWMGRTHGFISPEE